MRVSNVERVYSFIRERAEHDADQIAELIAGAPGTPWSFSELAEYIDADETRILQAVVVLLEKKAVVVPPMKRGEEQYIMDRHSYFCEIAGRREIPYAFGYDMFFNVNYSFGTSRNLHG